MRLKTSLPSMKIFPYPMQEICKNCGREFGDHKSKVPYTLNTVIRNKVIKCIGFISINKKTFFGEKFKTIRLAPKEGCKKICNHIYCDLLRRAEGENLEN